MAKKHFWKVWLLPNRLTKDVKNDYIIEVSTVDHTLHNEDIARMIAEEQGNVNYETVLGYISDRDRLVRKCVLGGNSYQDKNVRISPRVTGGVTGDAYIIDPKLHKITFDATPTADFRKELNEEVGLEVLGEKADGGAVISMVTDVNTGKTDGTISYRGNIIITGNKIKVAPEKETGLDIFFVDKDGIATPPDFPLTENNPKRIVCQVPPVIDGVYTLKIVTRYTGSGALLKEPRTIVYGLPLQITS
jgi:hypothetical protein